jgi:1-acyl-sn-glycerol-3-phosphate acyltransferase
MSLISKEDLIQAAGLHKLGILKKPIAAAVMKYAKINEVNALSDKLENTHGKEFFDKFLFERNLRYITFEEDLAKIPKTGPFILVANHPLGALDGILMTKILSEIRPDFKIMGNFLLTKIKAMEPFVISVNPFENRKELHSSANGMRQTLTHLENGGCVGIFPAGEVSNRNNEFGEILDRTWEKTAVKLIKKAKVPVVPMYFHAKNSSLFYRMSKIHPQLQTLLLPAEMMNDRDKPIRIRIGKCISPKMIDEQESIEELGEFLKRKVYMMKSYYDKRKSLQDLLKIPNLVIKLPSQKGEHIVQNIIEETPKEDLIAEVNRLKENDKCLFCNGDYEIYFADYGEIPSIMREIGRQREITFRQVGEGTNLPFDLEEYDQYYKHLFLWDRKEEKLAGAYRMALGVEVMKKHFYPSFCMVHTKMPLHLER